MLGLGGAGEAGRAPRMLGVAVRALQLQVKRSGEAGEHPGSLRSPAAGFGPVCSQASRREVRVVS